MPAQQRTGHPQGEQGNENHDAQAEQDRRDNPTDAAPAGQRPSGGIHGAGVHLLKIRAAHDPGRYSAWGANYQAENSEDENKGATMWFHNDKLIDCPPLNKQSPGGSQARSRRHADSGERVLCVPLPPLPPRAKRKGLGMTQALRAVEEQRRHCVSRRQSHFPKSRRSARSNSFHMWAVIYHFVNPPVLFRPNGRPKARTSGDS